MRLIVAFALGLLFLSTPIFAVRPGTQYFDFSKYDFGANAKFLGKVSAESITNGFHPCPSMTDTQMLSIASPSDGDCVHNTTLQSWLVYNTADSVWEEVGGGGGISNWITAEDYEVGDVVIESLKIYQATIAHTSGTFATDLAGGKWQQIANDVSDASGVLPMENGGTDKNLTPTLGGVVYTDAGSMEILPPGTSGQVLQTNGAAAPTWVNKSITGKAENGSVVTVEEIQVPNNQLTETDTNKHRIETGNGDLFANPSFEHATARSSWDGTILGITGSTSSDRTDGVQSYCQTFTGEVVDLHQDSALYESTYATMRPQGFGAIDVKTAINSTPIYVCARLAGSYPSDIPNSPLCRVVDTNDIFRTYDIDFVFGGTSNGYGVTSNGVNVTGTICYDNAKLKAEDRRQNVGAVGSWTTFTPTGSWVSNTTYAGKYRQVGQNIEIQYLVTVSGAPTSTQLSLNLPSGFTIDTSKLADGNVPSFDYKYQVTPFCVVTDSATASYPCVGYYSSTTAVILRAENAAATYVANSYVTQAIPITFGANDSVSATVIVPVTQFSGSTAAYSSQCGALCETDFKIRLNTLGAVASDDFDIINGDCVVSGTSNETKTCTFNSNKFSAIPVITVGSCTTGGAGTDQNASISSLSTTGFVVTTRNLNNASSDTGTCLIVSKTGADITLARKIFGSFKDFDYVYVEASSNSSSAIGTPLADIIFEDESIDTRNAYNSSTGVFTVPAGGDGIYSYRAFVLTAPVNLAASQRLFCKALKNGADYSFGTRSNGVGVSQNHSSLVDIEAYLVAGDTLKTQCMTDVSTTLSGVSSGANLTIKRLPGQAP